VNTGPRFRRATLLVVAAAVVLAGCGITHPQNLNYRVDKRLHFIEPRSRTLVHAPVTVRWTIRGFTIEAPGTAPPRRDAGYFAVFVDRAPIKPGQTVRAVASGDRVCQDDPACPDEQYLEQRRVYTTAVPSLTLTIIPPLAGHSERVQYHAITVVLMSTDGHRLGESSWELDVRMRRLGL
jgi:hypothetical protein